MKGYKMTTKEPYKVGDYVLVELDPEETCVVQVVRVYDGHYEVLEYVSGDTYGELYDDDDNHRLIGR